jgi:hypothetical protein
LKLHCVDLSSVSCLLECTQAPHLTSLVLDIDLGHMCSYLGAQKLRDALPGVLAQLPRLSVLQLPTIYITDAALQQMGHLQGLRQLTLPPNVDATVWDLQHLPSSITQLSLDDWVPWEVDEPSGPTVKLLQLPQQLLGLLSLDITRSEVLPAALGSATQLRRLHLYDCSLLPRELGCKATEGTVALLDVLSKLKSLQDLKLQLVGLDVDNIPAQRFSALTASSQLTRLAVVEKYDAPIAQAAAQHMFPAGGQALQLRELIINKQYSSMPDGLPPGFLPDGCCLDSAGLAAIVSACPGLQHLDIADAVQPSADVSALLQLPQSCTHLGVGGEAFGDVAVPLIAQLTQLKVLSWSPRKLTAAGAQQLEAIWGDRLCW